MLSVAEESQLLRQVKLLLAVATYTFIIAALLLGFAVAEAFAQERVVLEPGDSLAVLVLELPPIEVPAPETVYVPTPPVTDTVYECPPGWNCSPPIVESPDTIPPLAVSGLTLSIDGSDLVVEWNDRPSPDRGGVETDGYYVAHGFQEPGHDDEPTVDVDGTPHRIALTGYGERWVCVTPHNDLSGPSSCNRIAYDAPPEPASPYLLSVAPEPYSISGNLEVVEGTYSVHLDRIDGTWNGLGDVSLPSVDSVVFCSGGVCNREGRLPYELGGGKIPLTTGSYVVSWEVFGDEPDSGSSTVIVTAELGDALGKACAWGELRCRIVGDALEIAMDEGSTLTLYATWEFEGDSRIFAVLPNNYAEAKYDTERGWICLVDGGEIIPVDGTATNFPAGTLWVPPPTCPASTTDV